MSLYRSPVFELRPPGAGNVFSAAQVAVEQDDTVASGRRLFAAPAACLNVRSAG